MTPHKSSDTEATETRKIQRPKGDESPDIEVEQDLSFVVLCVCLYPYDLHGLEQSEGTFDWTVQTSKHCLHDSLWELHITVRLLIKAPCLPCPPL